MFNENELKPAMVSQCANPSCTAHLKYLHEGRFFVLRTRSAERYWGGDAGPFGAPPGKQIQCFWLCQNCAREMTIGKDGRLVGAIDPGIFREVGSERLVA
jgi:hypothetical protein